ncbi:MAG: GTP-binding protein [Candidatus Sumerlaeia bacterium]|nr:GTP-binding protein [Candidatus Sumerlaeia bacterium]
MDLHWLRIVVVGHVDHGKSTLIGRLLHDSGALPEGRLDDIARADAAANAAPEWALLLDHFHEEREQERTIDSTQAFFATGRRVYRIIDAPGHREFLKNMVTGAAQADAAVLVIDVEAGVMEQTRRHAALLALLGQTRVIAAVNKMDRVGGRSAEFARAAESAADLLAQMNLRAHAVIPISAQLGWNLAVRSEALAWYDGPTLFEALDSLPPPEPQSHRPLRFPVQDVYPREGRPRVVGRVESGRVAKGQAVLLLPDGVPVKILSVERFLESRTSAEAGECVGLTLEAPQDVRRGMVLCDPSFPAKAARRLEANMFWLANAPWEQGDALLLRCATQEAPARIERVIRRVNSATLETIETDAMRLEHAEVARVVLELASPVAVDGFGDCPPLGRFVLVKNQTVCAGGTIAAIAQ